MESPSTAAHGTKPKPRKIGGRSPLHWAIFQIHWLFGITIGIVLGVMGVTGAMMAFEDPIMESLSRGVMDVAPQARPILTPDQVLAHFAQQLPGSKPTSITLRTANGAAPQVTFTPAKKGEGKAGVRPDKLFLDPYDGHALGHATGEQFFATVRRLHRFLLLPGDAKGPGRQITGIAALSLVGFLVTGIYLRWPRRPLNWRLWLKPNLKARKRGLYFSLHQVVGTWVLPIYLIIALTGLTFSYPWYKAGFDTLLTGHAESEEEAPAEAKKAAAGKSKVQIDKVWRAVVAEAGPDATVIITIPKSAGPDMRVRYLSRDAGNDRAFNELRITPDGDIRKRDMYASHSLGEKITIARLAVHRGSFFGLPFAILFMLAALTMPLFPVTGYLLYLGRRKSRPVKAKPDATKIN